MLLVLSILDRRSSCMTALFGRVWCGWACPQTVYMEFLFRPIERLFEGGRRGSLQLDREQRAASCIRGGSLKYAVYLVLVAVPRAHLPRVLRRHRPARACGCGARRSSIPTSFLVMAVTTALDLLRLHLVPRADLPGRLPVRAAAVGAARPAVADRRLRPRRAASRARTGPRNARPAPGDCIDCGACVITCPTGIDIRDGLQMECIHCTQCIDACDAIMAQGRQAAGPDPLHVARRRSRASACAGCVRASCSTRPRSRSRSAASSWRSSRGRRPTSRVLRGIGAPFAVEADGRVANQVRIKITNRDAAARTVHGHRSRASSPER